MDICEFVLMIFYCFLSLLVDMCLVCLDMSEIDFKEYMDPFLTFIVCLDHFSLGCFGPSVITSV